MSSAHVPVEILGFHIEHERVRQQLPQFICDLFHSILTEIGCDSIHCNRLAILADWGRHFTCCGECLSCDESRTGL
jgi:hypothetical protein